MKYKIDELLYSEDRRGIFLFRVHKIDNEDRIWLNQGEGYHEVPRTPSTNMDRFKELTIDKLIGFIWGKRFVLESDHKWAMEILLESELNDKQKELLMNLILTGEEA